MANIDNIGGIIHTALRAMGAETARCDGMKCGLRGYPFYHETLSGVRSFPRKRWEEPFWEGLRHRLQQDHAIPAQTEKRYPGSRNRCDLVLTLEPDQLLWIEGKLLMEHYWVYDCNVPQPYYWENPTPKHGQWDKALQDVCGKDLAKLTSLSRSDAQYIGLLVLGFDRIGGKLDDEPFYRQW